ncbi:hypothetical protein NUSPORA_01097 [Nucleospora cyclopteri]
MFFVKIAENLGLLMLALSISIKAPHFQVYNYIAEYCKIYKCNFISHTQILYIALTKMALLLMIFNLFNYKIAKRFLIENLFVISANLKLAEILHANIEEYFAIFLITIFLLFFATLAEKFRNLKHNLFVIFCYINIYVFLLLVLPDFRKFIRKLDK